MNELANKDLKVMELRRRVRGIKVRIFTYFDTIVSKGLTTGTQNLSA